VNRTEKEKTGGENIKKEVEEKREGFW